MALRGRAGGCGVMFQRSEQAAVELGEFVAASPSPYHVVETAVARLGEAGFALVDEGEAWPSAPGRYVTVRGGSLVAWSTEHLTGGWPEGASFTVLGGHTDSPNLRVKPSGGYVERGWDMLGVEVYGGPLLATWFDRDLGLSGRVAVRDASAPAGFGVRTFRCDEPLLRVANLAIHLDRSAAEGAAINKQQHLAPIWGATGSASFSGWLAEQVGVAEADVLGFDAMTHDLVAPALLGRARDVFASPRLDNLATAWAGVRGLIEAVSSPSEFGPARVVGGWPVVPVVALFDHEEIGSQTASGAQSQLLESVLERVVLCGGGSRADVLAAWARSLVVSADVSHAVHPNYAERYEPRNHPVAGGGPVLKVNAQGRYASDAVGAAAFRLACERAGVPVQVYVHRTDLPCGSTIGPASAAGLGATTVDVGAAVLSMHSVRELIHVGDVDAYARALASVLGADVPVRGLLA